MGLAVELTEYAAFGKLIRERRLALRMSQEALAAAAFGNPDRKSFVSAIENNRLATITTNTARRLSGPLELSREELPASLRWPSADGPAPIEQRVRALEDRQSAAPPHLDERALARFLNARLAEALKTSVATVYRKRLVRGLRTLRIWTGRPFSFQSLLACYALSLLYVVLAGAASFLQGSISIGEVRLFRSLEWGSTGLQAILPFLNMALLCAALGLCWYLIRPFGVIPFSDRQAAMRLGVIAVLVGLVCGVADYTGTRSVTAGVLFVVPCCAAVSTFSPGRAAVLGAVCGFVSGIAAAISSAMTDADASEFLVSLSEGTIIGGIVGASACCSGSLIARGMPHLRPAQLAAAGGGIAFGSLVALIGISIASLYGAVWGFTIGLFVVSWVAIPFANTILDYASLGVSHWLGRYIAVSPARRFAIGLVLLVDLALAVLFMVLSVIAIGLVLAGVSGSLGIETRSRSFLETSVGDPWGQGLWLTIMVLSTTVWTVLHFGVIVAPLAAAACVRRSLERPAMQRLESGREKGEFDLSIGVLASLRFVLFHACWFAIVAIPVLCLVLYPGIVETILRLGWRVTDVLI